MSNAPQITTLSTYQKPSTSIDKLLPGITSFEGLNDSEPIKPSRIGAIPIYGDRKHLVNLQTAKQNNRDHQQDDVLMEDVQKTIDYELKNFVELKKFKPNGLKDQLFEIVITGVKLGGNSGIIEQVLNEIILDDHYVWSFIDGNNEDKILYIRFNNEDSIRNVSQIRKFQKLNELEVNGSKWIINVEDNTEALIKDTNTPEVELNKEELISKVDELLKSNTNLKKGNGLDLDYQVDEAELIDLPPESLPQLIRDIKDFRLKVLENEKKKRERESLEEAKRSKGQLRKLFERFKNEANEIVEDDEESDEDSDDEGGDDLTDEQYENQRIEKENQEMLNRYKQNVEKAYLEERHNLELIEELKDLQNYESDLDKVIHSYYEQGKFKPSNRDKILEEEKDNKDRQDELKELEIVEQSRDFLNSINIPLKVNLSNNEEHTKSTVSSSSSKVELLNEDELNTVLENSKPLIESFIEEFLGVKEDELLEYLIMIIKDTKNKSSLVEELKETFDDDSIKIGDKVWNELETQSSKLLNNRGI